MDLRPTSAPSSALRLVAVVALIAAPLPAVAQSPATAPAEQTPADQKPRAPADKDAPVDPVTAPPEQPKVELVAPPNNVSQSAGVGGTRAVANDAEARRARAELEGTALSDKPAEGVPDRLPPLQRGAWWTLFAGFALAATGGVFAGLAETEEDRAERVVATIDPDTGGALQYTEARAEYEEILARGRRDAAVAQGLLIAGAAVLAAGVGLFIADGVKRKKASRVRAGLGGLQIRF
jgi:hypothetical protein